VKITEGIHRLGPGLVNVYLVEDAGAITIVDAGMPGDWSDLLNELAAMGRSLDDVRALVLTHGHSDHIGFAERARKERGWTPRVHELDAALARGEVPNPAKGGGPIKPLPLLRFILLGLRRGGLRPPKIQEVATYGDGATLDVPGAPRVILLPGHTPGSAALHVPTHDVVFVGDAMATYSPADGLRGPQVAAFSADYELAKASLARLEGLAAALVLPGHGDPFAGGIDEAVRLAREARLPE
jgi:glyoxylase-like metal-dependent hydrolase (beta-lactamase superfamily II)